MKKITILSIILLCILTMTPVVLSADVTIEAKKQSIQADINKGFFEGDVKVQVGDVMVESKRAELDLDPESKKPSLATFFDNPYAWQEQGNKRHEIKSDIMKVSLINKHINSSGNTQSIILENREPVLTVTADSQEYDINTKTMKAHKNVLIKYKDGETYSREATAIIDTNGDIKHIELIGDVVMKNKKNVVKGQKFVYEPSRDEFRIQGNTTSDLTFEDGTKIFVSAKYQQLNRKARTVIAGGDVKVLYEDYVAIGPKVQVLPDTKTGKPNYIIFQGRSKISQKGSTIEADRIKMTMKPKGFFADGNVKTFLHGDDNDNLGLIK